VGELVSLLKSNKPISVRWIFRIKTNPIGIIVKYKASFVLCGFLQKAKVDYKEVFTPVTQIKSVRTMIVIAN